MTAITVAVRRSSLWIAALATAGPGLRRGWRPRAAEQDAVQPHGGVAEGEREGDDEQVEPGQWLGVQQFAALLGGGDHGLQVVACQYSLRPHVVSQTPRGVTWRHPDRVHCLAGREEFQQPGRIGRAGPRVTAAAGMRMPGRLGPGSHHPGRRGRVRIGATCCLSQQAEQAGPPDGFRARGDPQLGVDAFQVRLDRVHRHEAFACDPGVGEARGQEP